MALRVNQFIRAVHQRRFGLAVVTFLLVLGVLFTPAISQASSLRETLQGDEEFFNAWNFFRSAINWLLVAGLMVVAFANVLRLNIDTYGVKKILPTLLVAFVLANFSLFIAQVLYDLSESLVRTAIDLAGFAGGATTGGTNLGGEVAAAAGNALKNLFRDLISASTTVGAGWIGFQVLKGLIVTPQTGWIAFGFVLALLALPLLVLVGLWVLFLIRHYVLQFLIIVSPVGFMLMAFPFSRNLFQTWFKHLMLWTFMRPVAFFIFAIGAIILKLTPTDGGLEGIVNYAVGTGAIVAAITVPFRMGGWIMSGVAKLGKMGALNTRTGIAGWGQSWSKQKDWRGGIGKRISAFGDALHLPEQIMAARERRKATIETEAKAGAAFQLGEHQSGKATEEGLVQERGKEYQGLSARETLQSMRAAIKKGDKFSQVAGLDKVYNDNDRSNFLAAIEHELKTLSADEGDALVKELMGENMRYADQVFQRGTNGKHFLKDTDTAKAVLSASVAGATLEAGTDSKGRVIHRFANDRASQMAYRKRQGWDKLAKRAQFYDESGTADSDAEGGFIASEEHMREMAAANLADNDPQKVNYGMNKSSLTRREQSDADGSTIGRRMDEGFAGAIADGSYGTIHLSTLDRFAGEAATGLGEVFSKTDGLVKARDAVEAKWQQMRAGGMDPVRLEEFKRQGNGVLAALYAFSAKPDRAVAQQVVQMIEAIPLAERGSVDVVLEKIEQHNAFGQLPLDVQERINQALTARTGATTHPGAIDRAAKAAAAAAAAATAAAPVTPPPTPYVRPGLGPRKSHP